MPIFLIGFMGSGKTTLGRALERHAAECGAGALEYVDLDELIERHEGMSVREIFSARGEAYFRELESRMLRGLAGRDNVVVGCGGGTPCHRHNMEWMNANGLTVLLEAGHDTLLRRLLEAQEQRPLLAGMDAAQVSAFIEAKQRERAPYYERAAVRFCSDRLENAAEIALSCRLFFEMLKTSYPSLI